MTVYLVIFGTALSFLFLGLLFWPLEKVFPAKEQRLFRPNWWTDLAFFAGQYLFWGGCVLLLLRFGRGFVENIVPAEFRMAVKSQPWWLQASEVILLSDLLIYWGHRLQHRMGFLWRFHSIHHSAEHLDWLAAHREHPDGPDKSARVSVGVSLGNDRGTAGIPRRLGHLYPFECAPAARTAAPVDRRAGAASLASFAGT